MSAQSSTADQRLRAALDAIPSYVLVVDEAVNVHEYNAAAGWLFGKGREQVLQHRSGDTLRCVNACRQPKGCGNSDFCKTCVIRESVHQAFAGKRVVRRRGLLQLESGAQTNDLHILISASAIEYERQERVLLVIEDINLLVELQRIVPVCMNCKKVRDDEPFWQEVSAYFERHWATRFSHGLCPECAAREMGNIELLFPGARPPAPTGPAETSPA